MNLIEEYRFHHASSKRMRKMGYYSRKVIMEVLVQGRIGFRCGRWQDLMKRIPIEIPSRTRGQKNPFRYYHIDDIEKFISKIQEENFEPIYPKPRRRTMELRCRRKKERSVA